MSSVHIQFQGAYWQIQENIQLFRFQLIHWSSQNTRCIWLFKSSLSGSRPAGQLYPCLPCILFWTELSYCRLSIRLQRHLFLGGIIKMKVEPSGTQSWMPSLPEQTIIWHRNIACQKEPFPLENFITYFSLEVLDSIELDGWKLNALQCKTCWKCLRLLT